jgi:hypothetical protein
MVPDQTAFRQQVLTVLAQMTDQASQIADALGVDGPALDQEVRAACEASSRAVRRLAGVLGKLATQPEASPPFVGPPPKGFAGGFEYDSRFNVVAATAAPTPQPEGPPVLARFVEGSWHGLTVDEDLVRRCGVSLPLSGPRRFVFLCPARVREQVARGELKVTTVGPGEVYERRELPEGPVYHCAPRGFEDALDAEPGAAVIYGSMTRPRG